MLDRKGTTEEQQEENVRPRSTRFYRLVPNAFQATEVTPIGTFWYRLGVRPETPMGNSENLSVVTECGSGKIFTIHTTGDYGLYGNGYWRLSRVDDGPKLTHIAMARQDQHNEKCHHRSSATVPSTRTAISSSSSWNATSSNSTRPVNSASRKAGANG